MFSDTRPTRPHHSPGPRCQHGDLCGRAPPYVRAYFDEPKSLEELQQLAAIPRRGYDVHHIVERAAARRLGMSEDEIDAPSNLVRISTFKHWELNSWYETPSLVFSNQPPRKYLDGKDAEEHRRVGLIGLDTVGVLAP